MTGVTFVELAWIKPKDVEFFDEHLRELAQCNHHNFWLYGGQMSTQDV
jgi:hypothetical protein